MLWKDESCPLYEEATTKASEAIDQQTDKSERNKADDERCESEDNDTDWESEDCDSEIGVAAPLTPPVILPSSTSSAIRGDVGEARDEREGTNDSEGINNQKRNSRQTKRYGNLANENELDEVGITEYCRSDQKKADLQPVEYSVYTESRAETKFPGFLCARWKLQKHIIFWPESDRSRQGGVGYVADGVLDYV
ncbi:hypothetical protein DAPPUDRAFT_252701 [Daphnia pulex]|uniref:Uncharacterized protein n=1 Tax=Daphnia pulex TaxID=6669 RepID=E9H3A8_DAPPU|nr:hypothetical protein DAPPUDRAFT_252701 [Daphnia pulex]|eukprot:EFX73808.1 hypothetical protein DAPPUDRAFT_252701 [Daphnia pulex]